MKFLNALKNFKQNFNLLLEEDFKPFTEKQLGNLMEDQFGSGWIDRIHSVRGRLDPDFIEQVMGEASSKTSGNLGKLFEIMLWVTTDSRIAGMLEKRVTAVSRSIVTITPGDKDNQESLEASSFLEKYIEDIRFKSFLEMAMDGKLYGVTGFRNIIFNDGVHYVVKDPTKERQISQSRWWQERENGDNWGKLYIKNNAGEKLFIDNPNQVEPASLSAFIYKQKRGYYDTTGILVRIMKLYVLKIWLITFLAQTVERHGKPFIWTSLIDSQFNDDEFKSKIARVLKNFGSERWGIFPDGFDIQSLDSASSVGNKLHLDALSFVNTEMAISLLGQNLSTEVQGGSFAATSSHTSIEQRLIESDLEWLEEELNEKFFFWPLKMNFPNMPVDAFPKATLTPVFDVDVEKIARGFKAVSELVDVPVAEIRAKTQIRAPRVKEDADENATGADKYDEEIVGPSSRRRATQADNLLRSLGA